MGLLLLLRPTVKRKALRSETLHNTIPGPRRCVFHARTRLGSSFQSRPRDPSCHIRNSDESLGEPWLPKLLLYANSLISQP